MAQITPYTESPKSQAAAQQITFDMLNAMLNALDHMNEDAAIIENRDFANPIKRRTRREMKAEAQARPESAALPLVYFHDMPELDAVNRGFRAGNVRLTIPRDKEKLSQYPLIDVETIDAVQDFAQPEHATIMIPSNELEAPFSISAHLGENFKTSFFSVKGAKHAHGAGLTQLEKIIYLEAGQTAQGAACLPHENRSRQHWSKDASQIKALFSCTTTQAQDLKKALAIIGLLPADLDRKRTPKGSAPCDWLKEMKRSPERFKAGFYWFSNLAAELDAVAPPADEILDMADELIEDSNPDRLPDSDHPADIEVISATGYHLLDDPRDLIDAPKAPKAAPSPKLAKLCDAANGAKTYPELKAIGKSTFNSTPMPKPEANIFWKVYNRRKKEFAALNETAHAAINRIKGFEFVDRRWTYTGKTADLKKVAAWLHGDGKKALNELQANAVWEAWKEAKGTTTPKQATLTLEPSWIDDLYPGHEDEQVTDYHPE